VASPDLSGSPACGDELEEILVAGHDRHFEARRMRLHRQRADDIVGLVALVSEHGYAERRAGFLYE
jgi:hypothetical protein